jgi:hypothetical protein
MQDVDMAQVAALDIDHRIVYATSPVGRGVALGKGAEQAIAKLQDEQVLWGPVLKANSDPESLFVDKVIESSSWEDDMPMGFSDDPWQRSLPFRRKPARVLLSVSNEWYGTLTAELTLLDVTGHAVAAFKVENLSGWRNADAKPFVVKSPKELPVCDSATALSVAFSNQGIDHWGPSPAQLSLQPFVTNAETLDPLEITVGPMLRLSSKSLGCQLVAWLPDSTALSCNPDESTKATDQWVLSRLTDGDMSFGEEPGVLVGAPLNKVQAIQRRVDRSALQRFAKATLKSGCASIDDWLDLQTHCGRAAEYNFQEPLCRIVLPGGTPGQTGNPPAELLYGSLTKFQRDALRQGKTLSYAGLTATQRRAAETLAFGRQYSNYSEVLNPNGRSFLDPCEELPQGLVPQCGLRAKYTQNARILFLDPAEKNRTYYQTEASAQEVGFWSGPPPMVPKSGVQTTLFQVCNFEQIDFQWELLPGHTKTMTFQGPMSAPAEKPVTLDKLKEPYRSAARKGLDFMKSFVRQSGKDGG